MKKLNIVKLLSILAQAESLASTLADLARREKEAQATIDRILEDGLVDDGTEKEAFRDASFALQLVPSQRKKLLADVAKLKAAIDDEGKSFRFGWNTAATDYREALREKIYAALAPFFSGDSKQLHAFVDTGYIPEISAVRKILFEPPCFPESTPLSDRVLTFRSFLAKAEANAEKVGVTLVKK